MFVLGVFGNKRGVRVSGLDGGRAGKVDTGRNLDDDARRGSQKGSDCDLFPKYSQFVYCFNACDVE